LQAPTGVTAPARLRRFYPTFVNAKKGTTVRSVLSPPDFLRVEAVVPRGSSIVGYRTDPKTPLSKEDNGPVGGATWVLGDYFGVLGVRLVAGRNFSPEEVRAQNIAPVAIVSSGFARAQFGSERDAIDKPIDLGTLRLTIVGVAPPGFTGTDLDASEVWLPMNAIANQWLTRANWWELTGTSFIRTIMRTSDDGVVASFPAVAAAALKRGSFFRDTASMGAAFGSIKEMLSPTFNASEETIATRLAVVALAILLIACANVANLLLARALQRRREIGIRLALGVSRVRLVGQLLTESVVLATIGLVAAILMAAWCATALRHALLPDVRWGAPAVGLRTVGFGVFTALIAGLAAGLAPALNASRPNLNSVLKGSLRDGGTARSKLRNGLLISQIALSCVLLAGAGLFIRSLRQVESIDIGYDTNRLVFAQMDRKRGSSLKEEDVGNALEEAGSRIEKLPGVERIAYTYMRPMYGFSFENTFMPNGDSLKAPGDMEEIITFVSPDYFSAMGMRVLEGRGFALEDRRGSEQVLVVNSTFAKTVWPGESAVGKCFRLRKPTDPCRRVIGVVSNAHFGGVIEQPSMLFYVPLLQEAMMASLASRARLRFARAMGARLPSPPRLASS
jgi:predicted permease